ncbi:MAG TPA: hypothetical protein VNZ52_01245 [Candidatus Thermoplasmatota archaeon]|nr:hypothetical protein [Candidatus Thermoplasmatota archaeon]
MTQFATATTGNTTTADQAVLYWKISGIAVGAVAALGIVMNLVKADGVLLTNFLAFDWTHNVLHVILAAAAVTFGFTKAVEAKVVKTAALAFGAVYLLLGVLGFINGVTTFLATALNLHLEMGENLIHLAIGGYGVFAGLQN